LGGTSKAVSVTLAPKSGEVESRTKSGDDPVTEADTLVDSVLKRILPREGEGWLSEETHDDRSRLDKHRVWVVD
jgi:myo-inositol-1(or 4)-monophosphatase